MLECRRDDEGFCQEQANPLNILPTSRPFESAAKTELVVSDVASGVW